MLSVSALLLAAAFAACVVVGASARHAIAVDPEMRSVLGRHTLAD